MIDALPDLADTLALLLKLSGYEVKTAHDGPTAFDLACDFKPGIVVLDVALTDIGGYEVARRLRKANVGHELHIICLTGFGQPDETDKPHAAGCDDHLLKPVDQMELKAALDWPRQFDDGTGIDRGITLTPR